LNPVLFAAVKPIFEVSLSFANEAFALPAAVTISFAYKHPYLLGKDQMRSSTNLLTVSASLSEALVVFSLHQPFKVFS